VQQQRNQRQWTEFFLVPKGRPAEKSLDPLLWTMEFRSTHLGLHLASVVAWRFHQRIHLKAVTGEVGGAQSVTWSLDRNSIVDSNGSRLFSAGRPLGTRKNSVHCLWFLYLAKLQLFNTYTFPGEHYISVKRPRYVIFNITTLHMCKG
jgi:hypothetical protein